MNKCCLCQTGGLTKRRRGKVVANQVGLEQGAHLRISGTGVVQDQEVYLERAHVNQDWQDDETCYTGTPVPALIPLDKTSSQVE